MKTALRAASFVALASVIASLTGCGHSGSYSSEASGESSVPGNTRADREARDAARTELQRHFVTGPDGWTTAVTTGNAYTQDHFLRQYKELVIEAVEPTELSESDHMNGFEWAGEATFKHTVCREAGGQPTFVLDGMANGQQAYAEKAPGRWSQWVEYTPGPLRFQKQKGRWTFQWDGSYLRGQLPGVSDFASAGVR